MKPKIIVDRSGPSGNVFVVMGEAANALIAAGLRAQSNKMSIQLQMAIGSPDISYEKILDIVREFVEIEIV